MMQDMRWSGAIVLLLCTLAYAGEVTISFPRELLRGSAEGAEVKPAGRTLSIVADAGRRLTVNVETADGLRLVGVDMSWYRPVKPAAEQLSEEDRAEIAELLTVPSFSDRVEPLHLAGDADHVTALVQLVRDRDFHAGKGELIWRMELWYFEFANGGWLKVSQQNKVLDRQRFESANAYRDYTRSLRYVPALGGVEVAAEPRQVNVLDEQLIKVGLERNEKPLPRD